MPIFKFYKFQISSKAKTMELFSPNTPASATPEATDSAGILDELLHTGCQIELAVPKDVQNSEWEIFHCKILRHDGGVALMVLENNRYKHTIINMKDVEHEHHPFCHVILDNRPGHQYVGIERNSAFGTKTDKVANILCTGLSLKLHEYHRKMEIERLTKKNAELWNVVDQVMDTFDDRVVQIRLDYQGDSTEGKEVNRMLGGMLMLAKKSDSDALFALNGKTSNGVRIDDIRTDLQHIAEMCLKSPNYALAVKFKNFGVYRYGADLMAQFGTDDNVINDFATGKTVMNFDTGQPDYDLRLWLDRLERLMTKDYKNEPIQSTRTRRHRR